MDKPVRILHLEDDAVDMQLVQATIETAGMACQITVVQSRDQFSEALRKREYDVILADYSLPGYDGLSALRLTQQVCPHIPFILVSGTMGEDPAIETLTEGATDYVLKQKLSRLVPAVKRALREAENRRERERMENVLRESEERFRTLAEKSLVGVYIIQDRLFRYVNPAFAEILGYGLDEIIDKLGPVDLLATEDKERVLDSIRRRINGEMASDHLEFYVHRKDGATRSVEVFGSRALHRGRPAVLGTLIDVTERRKSEEKLLQANKRWSQTFDAVPDLIAVLDNDFRILQANEAMARRLGVTPEECAGQLCYEVVHGTDVPPSFCPHQRSLRDGKGHMVEVSEECLGGEFIIRTSPMFDSQGLMIGSVHVVLDITKRKRAEKELDRVNRRNSLLLESAGEGIFGLNSEGKVIFVNPVAGLWLGYDPEELVGRRSHELIHFQKANKTPYTEEDCPICMTYKDGTTHRASKEVFWKKDGTSFPVEYTSTPILENNKPVGAVITFRDVTEREEMEKRLLQAQKMEAIGTLAGGIAHDFNNILTPIIAHTEMALDSIPDKSPLKLSLPRVLKAAERARDLVEQILSFSRQKEGERVILGIGPIVKEVFKLLRASLPATIEIRVDIQTEPWSVFADPIQIHQILMNLCTNASHAMGKRGGVLEIGVVNKFLDPGTAADIPHLPPGPYLELSVTDTGQGMGRKVMERIFEPYFTTKGKGEGTGLGLAVVHGIVVSLGGAVAVESETGKGTAFHVHLPAAEREAPLPIQSAVSLPGGTERILLVDDEESIIEALEPMLENLGYSVIARTSSVEALALFQSDATDFDLVITDQTMPGLTGTELAKKILRIRPDIPILLCSGFSETVNEEKPKAKGIRGYIMKPVLRREMAAIVRRVLDEG
jgi:PAS domain S-box-containing protein